MAVRGAAPALMVHLPCQSEGMSSTAVRQPADGEGAAIDPPLSSISPSALVFSPLRGSGKALASIRPAKRIAREDPSAFNFGMTDGGEKGFVIRDVG
jgi:hypothetical protein